MEKAAMVKRLKLRSGKVEKVEKVRQERPPPAVRAGRLDGLTLNQTACVEAGSGSTAPPWSACRVQCVSLVLVNI